MDHSRVDHRLTGFGGEFVVFAETAIAIEPTKGSLDDPATGQHHESLHAFRTSNDLQHPTTGVLYPLNELTSVAVIGPYQS